MMNLLVQERFKKPMFHIFFYKRFNFKSIFDNIFFKKQKRSLFKRIIDEICKI